MSLIAFAVFVFVLVRVTRRRRLWRGAQWGACSRQMYGPRRFRAVTPPETPAAPPAPRETAFDALKRRYVAGQMSDEQYERELDALLRTPEGKAQIQ